MPYKITPRNIGTYKCPVCRIPLRKLGDHLNLINKTKTEIYICDKCKYERNKPVPFKWDFQK